MATVYSLICFGGLAGKTVTFTDAGDIVNLAFHGLRNGTGVVFSTTTSLPTGITAGTTYYARNGADNGKFTIHTSAAGAIAGTGQVTFTGTGTGTHTVKGAYRNGLTTDQKARYGSAGSERIYNGLAAWVSARGTVANTFDVEVVECGEAFYDYITTVIDLTNAVFRSYRIIITSTVNGVRGEGFHNGSILSGYNLVPCNWYMYVLRISRSDVTIDGISFYAADQGVNLLDMYNAEVLNVVKNCVFNGDPAKSGNEGFSVKGTATIVCKRLRK
jgi:hypothetical protein